MYTSFKYLEIRANISTILAHMFIAAVGAWNMNYHNIAITVALKAWRHSSNDRRTHLCNTICVNGFCQVRLKAFYTLLRACKRSEPPKVSCPSPKKVLMPVLHRKSGYILPTIELCHCSRLSIHQSVYGDNAESPQKSTMWLKWIAQIFSFLCTTMASYN